MSTLATIQGGNVADQEPEHWKDSAGLCVPQCSVCKENLRAGLNPDGTPRTPGLAYLIQSREGYWWRPEGKGYTSSLLEAGVFTEDKSLYLLGESYSDRNDSVCLARPHLDRAFADLQRMHTAAEAIEA